MWVPFLIMRTIDIAKFMVAGKAEFVVEDTRSGSHREYLVSKHRKFDQGIRRWNVLLMHHVDGEKGLGYLGFITKGVFNHHSLYSVYDEESDQFTSFDSLFLRVVRGQELPVHLMFHHLGRCSRCGRKLTDPESITRGLGPKCAKETP